MSLKFQAGISRTELEVCGIKRRTALTYRYLHIYRTCAYRGILFVIKISKSLLSRVAAVKYVALSLPQLYVQFSRLRHFFLVLGPWRAQGDLG